MFLFEHPGAYFTVLFVFFVCRAVWDFLAHPKDYGWQKWNKR